MSSWAEIDNNNVVLRVLVGNDNLPNEGYDWFVENLGGTWIKASYNTFRGEHRLGGIPLRKNFPSPGYLYIENIDAFVLPKPYNSWSLNEDTGSWESPVPLPDDGGAYIWNEELQNWELEDIQSGEEDGL
jgi:hypothetical protein